MPRHPLSSPTGNFCGTPVAFVVFSPLGYGLWLSLVERLNGVQEVPGSNPGSPIFRCHLNSAGKSEAVELGPFGPLAARRFVQLGLHGVQGAEDIDEEVG